MAVVTQGTSPNKLTMTIIWGAMAAACIIYWVIGTYFIPPPDMDPKEIENTAKIFEPLMGFLALINLIMGIYFGWVKTSPKQGERASEYYTRALSMFIVGTACFEAIAILGLVLRFVGDTSSLFVMLVALGFILVLFTGTRIGVILANYEDIRKFQVERVDIISPDQPV